MPDSCEERASVLRGSEKLIFKLMCKEATPRQWAEWLRPPLEHAAAQANSDLVEKLVKAGAGGGARWRGFTTRTVLGAAAEGGNEQVATTMLTAGTQPEITVEANNTTVPAALCRVACLGHRAAATSPMAAVSDANTEYKDCRVARPLHAAMPRDKGERTAYSKLLLLLIGGAASHHDQTREGRTALHLAALQGFDQTVQVLLSRGMDVNAPDNLGMTPLHAVAEVGHVSTAKILLAAGADAGVGDLLGNTPLHTASRKNNAGVVNTLVEAGSDIEARCRRGLSPLSFGASLGNCAAMLALLRHGANLRATSTNMWSALHRACARGKADAADLLLRWGADETALTTDGETPGDLIPAVIHAPENHRPRLEQLDRLLARAPQDRAWRRRGYLALCRADPGRLRLGVDSGDMAAGVGEQERSSDRDHSKGARVKGSGGGGTDGVCSNSEGGGGHGLVGGFDGVAGWVVSLEEEGVFRHVVGYL